MKRITSTLLLAAVPALVALPSWGTEPVSQAQRGGAQAGSTGAGAARGAEKGADEGPEAPGGFDRKDRTGVDVFGRRTKLRGNTFEERIQGGWRLTRMQLGALSSRGRKAQGFLHIGESFLSMELHALWDDTSGAAAPPNDIHTTFTAEYHLENSGKLYCTSVIGSFIDDQTAELRWERTGYEREFTVREILNELELTFVDESGLQSRLYFKAYLPRGKGRKDIFGRNEVGSYGSTDIYGRKQTAERGARDIYGRPAKPPEDEDGDTDGTTPESGGSGGTPLSDRRGR